MTVSIFALAKGGYSAQGAASYDARDNCVLVRASEGETVNFRAEFPENVVSVDTSDGGGVEISAIVISGKVATFDLSDFRADADVQLAVQLSTGEVRYLNIAIGPALATRGSSSDYGVPFA